MIFVTYLTLSVMMVLGHGALAPSLGDLLRNRTGLIAQSLRVSSNWWRAFAEWLMADIGVQPERRGTGSLRTFAKPPLFRQFTLVAVTSARAARPSSVALGSMFASSLGGFYGRQRWKVRVLDE